MPWKNREWIPLQLGTWFVRIGPRLPGTLDAGRLDADMLGLAAPIRAGFLSRPLLTLALKAPATMILSVILGSSFRVGLAN